MKHAMLLGMCLAAGCVLAGSRDASAAGQAAQAAGDAKGQVEQAWLTQDAMRRHAVRPQAAVGGGGGKVTTTNDAAGGVDGVKDGGYGFHTDKEQNPWWQVDLGKSQPLDHVLIYNRCTSDPDRAYKFCLLLSDDGKAWRQAYRHDGTPFFGVKDNKPLNVPLAAAAGRFVRIQLAATTWLHLDEVEVYAAADPKANIALRKVADQSTVCEYSHGTGAAAAAAPAPAPAEAAPEPKDGEYPIQQALARGQGLVERRKAAGLAAAGALAAELAALAAKAQAAPADPQQRRDLYLQVRAVVRKLVLADPLLNFDKLLFVKRQTFCSSHIYTDHFDGSRAFGGNLCILSPVAPDGQVTELVPSLAGGLFERFDLSSDAKRVVFAYKKPGSGYRIYEVGIDGSGLRQLTADGADEPDMIKRFGHGYDDMDPCYLPGGRIMFASTRSRRTVLCDPRFTTTSLHLMDADGGNLHCISANTVNEFTPSVLGDGRVIYTRWEYIDKGCGDVQSLWSVRPDGSHSAHVYKNNVNLPATLIDARGIPGTALLVAVGAPHMPLAVGPVVLIDVGISQRTSEAMTNLTPEIRYPGHAGYPTTDQGYYKEPYPLAEDLFLVAYNDQPQHAAAAGYGLYVLDACGNRELIYRDAATSCWQPIPLRPRPMPAEVPPGGENDAGLAAADKATLFMQDVYQGMDGIQRGRVKYLRVVEDVAKPWAAAYASPGQGDSLGLQNPAVSLKGHFAIKKVHGVVPVNADGSAQFTAPAGRNLYMQALDANYMELQRMRTFVNLVPGERRSCIGCHEPRTQVPAVLGQAAAARMSVGELAPQPGDTGPRFVHYPLDVQPILAKHCVKCHSGPQPKGKLDLSGELTTLFNRSYENIINRKLINNIDVDPRSAFVAAEPPLTFGSHRSKLIDQVRKGHSDTKLSREEFIRLVTWVDTNANYYGIYEGKKNAKWKADPDFRPNPPIAAVTAAAPGR